MKLLDLRESAPAAPLGDLFGMMVFEGDRRIGITSETPDQVWKGEFKCSHLHLNSLKGAPKEVRGHFIASFNSLFSLESAPKKVHGMFQVSVNQLTSLKGIHKLVEEIRGPFYASNNPLKSHVLGLLYIKGCTNVKLTDTLNRQSAGASSGNPESLKLEQVTHILNKYLPSKGHSSIIDCQSDLLDAGLDAFAQL